MQKINVTHDSLPSAIGLLLDRTERLERLEEMVLQLTASKQGEDISKGGKRIATLEIVCKKYKIPKSTMYGKIHRGTVNPLRMPGSRKIYFDLDEFEASMSNEKSE